MKTKKEMGKALAFSAQKYPCLFDKAIPSFLNKNESNNACEAVAEDIQLESGKFIYLV